MNHLKIYNAIIKNAIILNRKKVNKLNINYVYYESHHIKPKCIGGLNEKDNLVILTAREHYICHKLLTYIYSGNKKLANAFCRMTWDKRGNRKISARDYAYARELKAIIPQTEETKRKRALANTGKKRTEETKQKTRNTLLGVAHTEKRKQNISNSLKGKHFAQNFGDTSGEKNGMYKKTVYQLWVEKYGIEEANRLKELRRIKQSLSMQGKNKGKIFQRKNET